MFSKILIANRGEIAVRIIKTCRRLGIETVVVYSDADAGSLAVQMADAAVRLGPAPASDSYLRQDLVIAAAKDTGCQAIHPGFGFLSENPVFATAVADAGLVFIGPNPGAIVAMGDKIASKKAAAEAGVSVVPGHMGLIKDAAEAAKIAASIGYPVMIKASAGGGGKGMRIAYSDAEARDGFDSAASEARSSFGDDRIFIEKFVEEPRHIEIQVLGDKHGSVLHLAERECSIQRRNQKVLEEAPSPFLDDKTRKAMGAQAVALSKAVDYDSAGTVEFIVDKDKNFYFLEMNTRLQVEHPVTEEITGIDLVEQMLRVAVGEKLAIAQKDVRLTGWALEARVYAEDPYRGFVPSIGRLVRFSPPDEVRTPERVVRVDTGVVEGDQISMFYDPMIAKLVTHAPTRTAAIDAMLEALDHFEIAGIQDNTPFVAAVLGQARFREGRLTTRYIQDEFPDGFAGAPVTEEDARFMRAAALFMRKVAARRAGAMTGRVAPAVNAERAHWTVMVDRARADMAIRLEEGGARLWPVDELGAPSGAESVLLTDWRPGDRLLSGSLDGDAFAVRVATTPEGFTVRRRGARAQIVVCTPASAALYLKLPEREAAGGGKAVLSPMPGLVTAVHVAAGDEVKVGQALLVVEAMKMENVIRAERDGAIGAVTVEPGASVAADEVLVEMA